jgi:hypothetical protein
MQPRVLQYVSSSMQRVHQYEHRATAIGRLRRVRLRHTQTYTTQMHACPL